MSWYSNKEWLCGSTFNMRGFLSDCKKHENTKSHMNAFKTWKIFSMREARDQRVDVMISQARREEIKRHNEEVRQIKKF